MEYFIESKGGDDYLFIESDAFESAFKIPYTYRYYPEVVDWRDDGHITITWKNRDDIILQAELQIGSATAVINGYEYDIEMAPVERDEHCYIPVNIFIALLEMDLKYDSDLGVIIIDRKEDFPRDILLGAWSDIDTYFSIGRQDIISGTIDYPSSAVQYDFSEDGTYSKVMVSSQSISGKDTILLLEGKYKICGNTLVRYDNYETLYQGKPMQLIHKKKKLDNVEFEYIYNYFPDEEQIKLDFLVKKYK
ncbi:MAG TPA: hypothetical protein GX501_01930 [Clostridiaceae bacterium]|nr:hypothetical protein [Clostridiaceae bacterium]